MKRDARNKFFLIIPRYLLLLGLMFTLPLIYKIFTPLTVYSTAFLLKLFYSIVVFGNLLLINSTQIEIIPSCVAGSAYLLLLILNLTISMEFKKRIFSILFCFISLFIINVLRIFILSVLLVNDFQFFDFTHKFFWYFFSTLFVVVIWFLSVKLFRIKEIPVYSDLKFLMKSIR